MFKLKLFTLSFVGTVCVLLAIIYVKRPKQVDPKLNQIANGLFVTSQLTPDNVRALGSRGFKNIVDIRPDGEASDQTPSSEIKQVAEDNDMAFHYIPVPHGSIPEEAVKALTNALSDPTTPTVLYCRTGNRAVRTYALVQASRTDGSNAAAIIKMVRDAGFSADDLKDKIAERIAHRNSNPPVKP